MREACTRSEKCRHAGHFVSQARGMLVESFSVRILLRCIVMKRAALILVCLLAANRLCAQTTVNTIHVTPALDHILITAYINPGTNAQAGMAVTYRKQGDLNWTSAHSGVRSTNDAYWLSTVIFGLTESTNYEVHTVVTDPGGVTNGDQTVIVQTRSSVAPSVSGNTYYVATSGNDTTGNGSSGNPWQSLSRADQSVAPGDTVLVKGGTYYAGQSITTGGSLAGGYIIYRAAPGETPVFDGSDPNFVTANSGNRFTPVSGRPGVFSANLAYEPVYVGAGSDRLYNYGYDENVQLDSLTNGTVTHYGVSYAVPGWLYQGGKLYAHLSGDVDPDTLSMHIVSAGSFVAITDADFVALIGLTIRYADVGIRVRGDHEATALQPASRFVWIDGNTLDHIASAAISVVGWTNCGNTVSTDASIGAPGAMIIRNTVSDATNVTNWPWDLKKGTDSENDAISLKAGDGSIVRENIVHDIFNGIGASNWGDCFWGGFPLESAGMNRNAVVEKNTITDIGDDVVEPEGAIINFVIQENKGLRVHTGISLAPIGEGPVWVVRNEVVDFVEGCLKVWDGMNVNRGWMLIYHNTFVSRLANSTALLIYPSSDYNVKVKIRNNIFQGTDRLVDMQDPDWANANVSLDYNDYYSSTGVVPAVVWTYSTNVSCPGGGTNDHCYYDTFQDWVTHSANVGEPQEQNGTNLNPGFVNSGANDFHLSDTSAIVDQGTVIPGINDDFLGIAPDPGAYESNGAPANDECGNAIAIYSTPYADSVDTTKATAGAGDPAPCSGTGENGLWYSFTSPIDTTVTADTIGSNYDTVLSAWSGTCGSFSAIDCDDNGQGQQSQISFSASAGNTYRFFVSDAAAGGGNLQFHLSANPSLLYYDDFEDGNASGWIYTSGKWRVISGNLTGTYKKNSLILSPFAGCADCAVESDLRAVTSKARVSLIGWYQDASNYAELILMDDKDQWVFKQRSAGTVVAKQSSQQAIQSGVDYHVKVEHAAGVFHVSVDGVEILTVAEGATATGTVGFRVKSTTGKSTTASFREIFAYD